MQRKSLIQVAFSLILALALVITTVVLFPGVASAEDSSDTAVEALEEGIEYYNQGDEENAELSFEEAIDEVLANKEVDVLIVAKQYLSKIKESQGYEQEAEELYQQSVHGRKALGSTDEPTPQICQPDCPTCPTENCERRGSGILEECFSC
ncbi:MAG: hypothetical protein QNJ54_22915 [Prochloraceae cyanobacterium]|nr:hypothetical protein [Prochloraceae cyanobacterium]